MSRNMDGRHFGLVALLLIYAGHETCAQNTTTNTTTNTNTTSEVLSECVCRDEWSIDGGGVGAGDCAQTQHGCTDCDGSNFTWCLVTDHCTSSEGEEPALWSKCVPLNTPTITTTTSTTTTTRKPGPTQFHELLPEGSCSEEDGQTPLTSQYSHSSFRQGFSTSACAEMCTAHPDGCFGIAMVGNVTCIIYHTLVTKTSPSEDIVLCFARDNINGSTNVTAVTTVDPNSDPTGVGSSNRLSFSSLVGIIVAGSLFVVVLCIAIYLSLCTCGKDKNRDARKKSQRKSENNRPTPMQLRKPIDQQKNAKNVEPQAAGTNRYNKLGKSAHGQSPHGSRPSSQLLPGREAYDRLGAVTNNNSRHHRHSSHQHSKSEGAGNLRKAGTSDTQFHEETYNKLDRSKSESAAGLRNKKDPRVSDGFSGKHQLQALARRPTVWRPPEHGGFQEGQRQQQQQQQRQLHEYDQFEGNRHHQHQRNQPSRRHPQTEHQFQRNRQNTQHQPSQPNLRVQDDGESLQMEHQFRRNRVTQRQQKAVVQGNFNANRHGGGPGPRDSLNMMRSQRNNFGNGNAPQSNTRNDNVASYRYDPGSLLGANLSPPSANMFDHETEAECIPEGLGNNPLYHNDEAETQLTVYQQLYYANSSTTDFKPVQRSGRKSQDKGSRRTSELSDIYQRHTSAIEPGDSDLYAVPPEQDGATGQIVLEKRTKSFRETDVVVSMAQDNSQGAGEVVNDSEMIREQSHYEMHAMVMSIEGDVRR